MRHCTKQIVKPNAHSCVFKYNERRQWQTMTSWTTTIGFWFQTKDISCKNAKKYNLKELPIVVINIIKRHQLDK